MKKTKDQYNNVYRTRKKHPIKEKKKLKIKKSPRK